MNLEWSREALADLNRFAVFLSDKHPALGKRVAQEIARRQNCSLIIRNSAVRLQGVRSIGKSSCRY
jgi:hypothetical protein